MASAPLIREQPKLGRPELYTPELAEKVCHAIANSQHGLRKTLEADSELPSMFTVYNWRDNIAIFSGLFADAKRRQLEAMAEDIVDTAMDDTIDPADKRLIVDTKKWLLSKLMPRTYGDKLDLTSGGEALPTPVHQIDARVQSIIMQAAARKAGGVTPLADLPDEALKLLE